jgi:hypothetical protein
MRKLLVCVSHWDDEFLMAASLLLSFTGECRVVFTSEGDCLTESAYCLEKKEFQAFTQELRTFREQNNLGPYIVDFYPEYGIRHVLMGIYPPEQIFSIQDTLRDCAYKNISEEEMDCIRKLYHCYEHKLRNFPLKMLETGFMFNGSKINTLFAQSFFLKRMIL